MSNMFQFLNYNLYTKANTVEIMNPQHASVDDISSTATKPTNRTKCNNMIKPKKLLVVEDNKPNSFFLQHLLERRGHYCEVASNGLIALNMMKATLSNFNTEDLHLRGYDVVLMNLVMPVMNGLDSTKAIRQLGYKGPIIGLTTLCFYEDLDLFIKAGLSAILVKPLNMDKVYSIINSEHILTNTSNEN